MTKLRLFSKEKESVKLASFIRSFANKSKRARTYKRKFWALAKKIEEYQESIEMVYTSTNFDLNAFEGFLYYLISKFPYRTATLQNFQQQLIKIYHEIERNGYNVDMSFSDYSFKEDESVSVYLDVSEIEKLNQLRLMKENAIVRDRFIVGCCTGLRYSDYSVVNMDNFQNKVIEIRTGKTGTKVVLPVHRLITDVLKRNHGFIPIYKNSQQNFNKVLKTLCKRAGINQTILIERMEGLKPIKRKEKKYNLICTHTARRSFATNAYLAGIETARIMLLTGHKTEESFFRYIRIGKKENAIELSKHPFFNDTRGNKK